MIEKLDFASKHLQKWGKRVFILVEIFLPVFTSKTFLLVTVLLVNKSAALRSAATRCNFSVLTALSCGAVTLTETWPADIFRWFFGAATY